ncbi:MAG: hypothetical protein CBB68_10960 [Rhodospirillaceae bacterium TMED8]|nr:hypothetical protein [Magnetovibrio sp.]OUT49927.1 MAG: hypothetical protein CBB68_10960 [Rhodospirillaceae bacterium TMED8]|tara:strand:- start:1065 stop:1358 length:294 start_codon:yes stop_codon:yes gene_type:complete
MANSKKLLVINILFVLAMGISAPAWTFNEIHLKKFKALNKCENRDLSEAKLIGADLGGVDLSTANLKDAKLDGAILCKTKMPWGEENSGCKKGEKTS